MKTILIIDYQAGNIHSVINAFELLAEGYQILVGNQPSLFKKADKIVLPGVGSFRHCALSLFATKGLKEEIQQIVARQVPTLGICVGMQLLFDQSFEREQTDGLKFFEPSIDCFRDQPECKDLKVPHMGWNRINFQNHPLFRGIDNQQYVYFANSYFAPKFNHTIATSSYGIDFSAAVAKDQLMGVQFHPEKSQKVGLAIIKNFLNL